MQYDWMVNQKVSTIKKLLIRIKTKNLNWEWLKS